MRRPGRASKRTYITPSAPSITSPTLDPFLPPPHVLVRPTRTPDTEQSPMPNTMYSVPISYKTNSPSPVAMIHTFVLAHWNLHAYVYKSVQHPFRTPTSKKTYVRNSPHSTDGEPAHGHMCTCTTGPSTHVHIQGATAGPQQHPSDTHAYIRPYVSSSSLAPFLTGCAGSEVGHDQHLSYASPRCLSPSASPSTSSSASRTFSVSGSVSSSSYLRHVPSIISSSSRT